MPPTDPATTALLRLTLTPGLGPVRIRELITICGSAEAAANAPASQLAQLARLGKSKAAAARAALDRSEDLAAREVEEAERLGVSFLPITDPAYPPLLRQIHDPPTILYIKGDVRAHAPPPPTPPPPSAVSRQPSADIPDDRYPIAIVGSRSCTHYGAEQAHRFAAHLAQCGLSIVSGGARGIDTAAHRGAVQAKGRTIVVMGCGLAHVYPPDNADLFDAIVEDGLGAIVSELPLHTAPTADNFPARNRIICGMSLGVLVVEAGRRSGAIITAHEAVEQGREVFALPSRVDSKAAEGTLGLLKEGAAQIVTHPDDILQALENPARHHHEGTHEAITANPAAAAQADDGDGFAHAAPEGASLFEPRELSASSAHNGARGARSQPKQRAKRSAEGAPSPDAQNSPRDAALTGVQLAILEALEEPRTLDQLAAATGLDPAALRAQLTILEIRRRVKRAGSRIVLSS